MGPFGVQEMILIFILALVLFGPKKLPELARLLGKGLTEFRRAKNELKSTFDTHMRELERETRMEELKKNPTSVTTTTPSYNPYAYTADEYGRSPSDYNYNGSEGPYLSEPPVQSHAAETPALPPAPVVPGTVPRSASSPTSEEAAAAEKRNDEHAA
jgi:TatA/E family protein of Tat protein translocase